MREFAVPSRGSEDMKEKLELRCTLCGYRALRASAPERCPMCQSVDAWIHAQARSATALLTR
jgi:rubrerythrin